MEIDVKGLTLSFGEKVIFNDVNFKIADKSRIGLVGNNGVGKTTLLRVLSGEVEPDGGVIDKSKNIKLGYLPQDLIELEPVPVMNFLKNRAGISRIELKMRDNELKLSDSSLSLNQNSKELENLLKEHAELSRRFEDTGGFAFESMAKKVLKGLGFSQSDSEKNCRNFSGGWKMRIAMAALLLAAPDVLLLDEPTNHLDTESMEWLESWLRNYDGAILTVSHDRRFLENMTSQTFDLERGKITIYPYGYERYLAAKNKNQELLEKAAASQRRQIEKIESFVNRFRYKATKAAQVQSRLKQLEKLEIIEIDAPERNVKFKIPEASQSGWEVIKASQISKNYGDLNVFKDINFILNRGERVALVGVNGAGKSTLLRLLSGVEEPDTGIIKYGHNVKMAFYSQESALNLNYENTIWDEARSVPSKLNDAARRGLLGVFLFSGDDIYKKISILSGGEKARLALFKLMLADSNLLILDEPTNHLDYVTRDTVERALLQYGGTLLIVSHDRHFLDILAERVLEIRDGRLYDYPGNYSWFLEKREELLQNNNNFKSPDEIAIKKPLMQNKINKINKITERQERQRILNETRGLRKNISDLEIKISRLEDAQSKIDADLCRPEVLENSLQVQDLMQKRSVNAKELEDAYSEWERLSVELENYK